jgi:ribosomal protein L40E
MRYRMSMIENLDSIKSIGLERFAELEVTRWICKSCGAMLCVHRENCLRCGTSRTDSGPGVFYNCIADIGSSTRKCSE